MFSLGSKDIFLIKYSSSGDLIWIRQTGTTSSDCGNGVEVSPDGKFVYIVGEVGGSLDSQPYGGSLISLIVFL